MFAEIDNTLSIATFSVYSPIHFSWNFLVMSLGMSMARHTDLGNPSILTRVSMVKTSISLSANVVNPITPI